MGDFRRPVSGQHSGGSEANGNIIARLPGTSGKTVVISGHYDTKPTPGVPFVGANDGGSSTGLLLELARVLPKAVAQGRDFARLAGRRRSLRAVVRYGQLVRQPAPGGEMGSGRNGAAHQGVDQCGHDWRPGFADCGRDGVDLSGCASWFGTLRGNWDSRNILARRTAKWVTIMCRFSATEFRRLI